MRRCALHSRCPVALALLACCVVATSVPGCAKKEPGPPPVTNRYPTLPPKEVPDYLKDSILQRADVIATNPMPVSSYGLVANLQNGTGDTRVGNVVRDWMFKQMEKRGFGSRSLGFGQETPERILNDPLKRFAIVRVDAFIPAGARKGDRIDVQVSCLENNYTTSLASGQLYRADLKIDGANPQNPNMAIDTWATAEGGVFVNPAYALERDPTSAEARQSLRVGVVMSGGLVQVDRPIFLRVRQPSYRMTREIEYRLDDYFQDNTVAAAMDDGVVRLIMPHKYHGDWEHFIGVVTHVFFNGAPQFATLKAQQLAEQSVKPDAPLLDISYCWEALGPNGLPFVLPMMTHENPDVAYAAARAAAFIGDLSATNALINMARKPDHPFRINAVQTLAALPPSPVINGMLRTLLNSNEMLVRLEAYRALASQGDAGIITTIVENKFAIDRIDSDGTPIIYAARRGTPRIAFFGRKPAVSLPITFTTLGGRLSISSMPGRSTLTIFYRGFGNELPKPIVIESNPDVAEIAARLGGMGPINEPQLNFGYGEVVAILQALSDSQKVTALASALPNGGRLPATFVLQEVPIFENSVYGAPVIPEPTRPQSDDQRPVSDAAPGTEPPNRQEARK